MVKSGAKNSSRQSGARTTAVSAFGILKQFSAKDGRLNGDSSNCPRKRNRKSKVNFSSFNKCQFEIKPSTIVMPDSPKSVSNNMPGEDSAVVGHEVFSWLLHPVSEKTFFEEVWEAKPLVVHRKCADYYQHIFSTEEFDCILRKETLEFSVNIDVTSYTNGERKTLNPVGRAYAPVVWDYYRRGCSVRLLNPQTYSVAVWQLNSMLQEVFGSFVGANVYLTPPQSQGFAPHWDDIEAFVLQLEGSKRWKVYTPRCEDEVLPRTSSGNLTEAELGDPILDTILEAGDLLYFPRGFIHQASCESGSNLHSLHITVSTTQNTSWADLFEKLIPQALAVAAAENVEFRRALPLDCANFMGIQHAVDVEGADDTTQSRRRQFERRAKQLFLQLWDHAVIDAAVDQMVKKYLHDSLPPVLSEDEKKLTVLSSGDGQCFAWNSALSKLKQHNRLKLLRRNCLRLVMEGNCQIMVYYNVANSRVFHAKDEQYFEIPAELAPAVEFLVQSYPEFVTILSLPLDKSKDKLKIASLLRKHALVMIED